MTPVYRPSLLLRLLGVQLLALALIWALFSAYQFHNIQGDGPGTVDYDIELISSALTRVASVDPKAASAQLLAEHFRDLDVSQADPPIRADQIAFRVWDADGVLLARSRESPPLPTLTMGELPEGKRSTDPVWKYSVARSPNGRVVALYAHTQAYYTSVQREFVWSSARSYLILAVLLTILLWVTLRVGLRPLNRLAAQVSSRQQDDLTPIQFNKPYREIDPLLGSLNDKINKVRAAIEREREFFTDAAHELRTPLSVIAAQAHVVTVERGATERAQAATELQSGIERASRVLNRMLLIGRLDASRGDDCSEPVEMAELVDDVVRQHRPRAVASGHQIAIAVDGIVRLANREHLGAALDCLIDNALKYTPSRTQIVVSVHTDGADTVIGVSDDGPGVPEDSVERIFKRFERLGRSDQEGSGLGLAIVRRIAELHGGSVSLRRGSLGGCVFEMRLPLRTASG